MAKIDIAITLPSGESVNVNVPEEWSDAQVHEALVASGEIPKGTPAPGTAPAPAAEPSAAEQAAFGYVDNPNMIGIFKELIERKVGTTDDVTTETEVIRQPGVPEDVPVFADDPGAVVEKQTFTQKGVSEEDIKARQAANHEVAMRTNFPELMQDADATRDSVPAKIGAGVRVFTDLLSVPLPGAKLKALAETVKGGKVLSSATGRAAAAASLEGAVGVGTFGAVDNSLRQLHDDGEIDTDELATATVLSAAMGAAIVPVIGVGMGKLMKRFGKALDEGKPITAEEILAEAPDLQPQQIDDLLAGFDEVAFAAKYEPKAKISMDANVNAAKAERDGTQSLIVAQREIARAKVHKTRTELAKKGEAQARKGEQAGIDEVQLTRNMSARNKDGSLKGGLKFGNSLIDRLENIAPQFSPRLRRVTAQTNARTHRDITRAKKFYEHKDYKRMSSADKKSLETAMIDSDGPAIREITGRYSDDLTANYEKNVRGLIDEIGTAQAKRNGGRDGFIAGYHPREIISVAKARKRMNRADRGKMQEALDDRAIKAGRPLRPEEVEATVRSFLKGRGGVAGKRRIDAVGEENVDLYERTEDALMGYIHRNHEEAATREFFEKFGVPNIKDGEVPDAASLAASMTKAMMKGELNANEINEAATLIHAIFGQGRKAPGKFVQNTKSFATVGAIANPISTATQFQDIAQLIHQHGFGRTIQALFSKKIANVFDVGLKNEAQMLKTEHGFKKAMQRFMQVSGFGQLDQFMATAGVNASLRKNFAHVKGKTPAKAARKYREMGFTESEAALLVDDLANRKITDLVRTLNVVENGKIRPVAIEDLPEFLVNSPNGRVFGTLMTWTLKQINRLRNGAYKDMRSPGTKMRGIGKLTSLLGLMGMTNMSVGSLKRWLKDEEQDPYSDFVGGVVGLGMMGKMVVQGLQRGSPEKAVMATMPYFSILGQMGQGAYNAGAEAWKQNDPMELLHAGDGIGSFRNYRAVGEGPLPEYAVAMLGGGYDALFGDNPSEKAVVVDTTLRPAPGAEGADLMPKPENMKSDQTFDVIKGWENSIQAGLDKESGRWYGHESLEGGTPTLAYGHKVTAREANSGKVKIGGNWVDYRKGLTEPQAEELFQQDMGKAREAVLDSLNIPLSQNELVALTSLVYNVGAANWRKSKARKALNLGNREEFMVEAYDPVQGFVRMNGEPHVGLIKRRQEEKAVFLGR